MDERSIMTPPSHTPYPTTLCPPARTDVTRPDAAAKRTAATTSLVERQRTMTLGRRSMAGFQTRRASS
jgi:hypothetical protein